MAVCQVTTIDSAATENTSDTACYATSLPVAGTVYFCVYIQI